MATKRKKSTKPKTRKNFVFGRKEPARYKAGDFVKALFRAPNGETERMWIKVTSTKGGTVLGILDNEPVLAHRPKLSLGSRVKVGASRIVENSGSRKAAAKKKTSKNRRNNGGLEDVTKTYRDFHGRDPEKIIVVKEQVHEHRKLAGLGDLKEMSVIAADERAKVVITFGPKVLLASNSKTAKKRQLFVRGGDQSVKLSDFGIYEPLHESEVLGKVESVSYFTTKDHLEPRDGGTAIYKHKFGGIREVQLPNGKKRRMRSPLPTLIYDTVSKLLSFAGGGYTIPDEGIDN